MMRILVLLAVVGFAACGEHDERHGPVKVSGLGGPCDGFTIHPFICADGLVCEPNPKHPHVADLPGICQYPKPDPNLSGVGGPCGGFIRNPHKCKHGLVCIHNHRNPDLPGTCERSSGGEGEPCDGIADLKCNGNLVCKKANHFPDTLGTCVRPGEADGAAGVGDTCAGFAGIRCERGLECVITDHFPHASGVCTLPVWCVINDQCPIGYSCEHLWRTLFGKCDFTPCTSSENCPRNYQCKGTGKHHNGPSVCVPPTCTNTKQCPDGYTCTAVGPHFPHKPKVCWPHGSPIPF